MEKHKYEYTKENVMYWLLATEKEYNKKYVKACNDIKFSSAAQEKARMYGEMKHAIQLLIIDFEENFE